MSAYRVKIGSIDLGLANEVLKVSWDSVLLGKRDSDGLQYVEDPKTPMTLYCKELPASWVDEISSFHALVEAEAGCFVFQCRVDVQCGGEWVQRWVGEFTTNDWRSDRDKETVVVKPKQADLLQCFKFKWKNIVNIWGTLPVVETLRAWPYTYRTHEESRPALEISPPWYQPPTPFVPQFCSFGTPKAYPQADGSPTIYVFFYHRIEAAGSCVGLAQVPPNNFLPWSPLSGSCPNPLFWACPGGKTAYNFPNGRYLRDVLIYLFDAMDCGLTLVSDFFNINPDGTHPDNTAYDRAADYCHNLMVFQKSDIKRHDNTGHSSQVSWTMRPQEAINDLKIMFNMDIRVENSGTARLEHVSYFAAQPGNNYTAKKYKRQLERDGGDVKRITRFFYRDEDCSQEFAGHPIEIFCGEGEEEKRLALFSCDIGFISDDLNAESIGDDGFCLVATAEVEFPGIGLAPGVFAYNYGLSWPSLHANFHKWNVGGPGRINTVIFEPESIRKTRKQPPFSFRHCCNEHYDRSEYQTTSLGDGEVVEDEINLAKDMLTITLKY